MDTEQIKDETPVADDAMLPENGQTDGGLGEFSEGDDQGQTSAETPVNQEEQQKPQWDTERQRADQAEANYRKLQREKAEIESKAADAEKRIADMEAKLNEVAKANDIDLDTMEDEFVDPTAYKVVKALQTKIQSLEGLADAYKKQETERQAKEREGQLEVARDKAKNEIITDIETEFGSQYRNDALKKAEEICQKRGYPPEDRYEAARILRQCYREVSSGKKPSTVKKPVSSDSGKAVTSANPKEDVRPGTLREVMQQMRAKAGLG